jgi:glucokinase
MRYTALAVDFDGTIAHDGVVPPHVVDGLRRLKETGRKLLLVTGRELEELLSIFPEVGIFLGTGVGGALIIDGRIHRGATGLAGDIGNYVLHAAPPAEDSRREVLDMVASRPAIAGGAAALASKRWAPNLREVAGTDVMDIKSNDLAESIRRGDKAVERLVRSRIAVVGAAISNFVDFINPDMVVLGGGLVEAMPALVRREVRKAIEGHAAPKAARAVHVVVARLHDHAVTAGAAKLALDMLSPQPPIVFRRL